MCPPRSNDCGDLSPTFNEHGEHAANGQFVPDGAQIQSVVFAPGHPDDFHARFAKRIRALLEPVRIGIREDPHGRLGGRPHELARAAEPERGVQDGPYRRYPRHDLAASGEQGVIDRDRVGTDEDRIVTGAETVDLVQRPYAGHRSANAFFSELRVEREGELERSEGDPLPVKPEEGRIQPFRGVRLDPDLDVQSGLPQLLGPVTRLRIGIPAGDHDAPYAGADNRRGARRRLPRMAARLERDVHRCARRARPRLPQRHDLRMVAAVFRVPSRAEHLVSAGHNGAHERIG